MLNDRKKKILEAIVEEYIETAEPVSSGNLRDKYGINLSSATIRNEMAELENGGFLDKTHTSSGRIPSPKGYRFYVDQLLKLDNISLAEMEYIHKRLETKVNEIEELTKIATSTLSEITHYTTLAIGPKPEEQNIEEFKFVLLGTRMLMAVILTDSGIVKETIIKFDEDITEEQVETLNNLFNSKLKGKPLEIIDKPVEEFIFSEMEESLKVIKPVLDQIRKAIRKDNAVYLQGANMAFDIPEFKSMTSVKNFMNMLDTKDIIEDALNLGIAQDINVYIGSENEREELKDYSVITFKHSIGNKELGTIGIIGPTRMNYSKVISVMKYISKKLAQEENEMNKNNKKEGED
ncbi:MAG: heat-inducible transcriptional repressor HrcA [Clostridia bacterium]|nr:heat-inducible transcriptional repressor HrcA [Clostridia bacterium]